jgi:hypothetical protein
MVRKASAEERISRGAAGDAQMDIFPALEPVTLSAIKLGSLCARVRNGRLALGIIVGSWLGAPHRSWIQFEGDGEAWRAVDIDEAAQEEEALNVRDARLWLRFESSSFGAYEDAALAGSIFVVGGRTAVSGMVGHDNSQGSLCC